MAPSNSPSVFPRINPATWFPTQPSIIVPAIPRNRPDLPFGGYYALGVCNDVNAMIELHMQGETSLFPLTHNPDLFAGQGEVGELARKLPVDGRASAKPDVRRILGSLPVDDLSQLPLPGLRRAAVGVADEAEAGSVTLLGLARPKPHLSTFR